MKSENDISLRSLWKSLRDWQILQKKKGGFLWSPYHIHFHSPNHILNGWFYSSLLSCSVHEKQWQIQMGFSFLSFIVLMFSGSSTIPGCVLWFQDLWDGCSSWQMWVTVQVMEQGEDQTCRAQGAVEENLCWPCCVDVYEQCIMSNVCCGCWPRSQGWAPEGRDCSGIVSTPLSYMVEIVHAINV